MEKRLPQQITTARQLMNALLSDLNSAYEATDVLRNNPDIQDPTPEQIRNPQLYKAIGGALLRREVHRELDLPEEAIQRGLDDKEFHDNIKNLYRIPVSEKMEDIIRRRKFANELHAYAGYMLDQQIAKGA